MRNIASLRGASPVILSCLFGLTSVTGRQLSAQRPPADRHIAFETQSGTWMTVDVSPDGKNLVFDLLGHIYQVPVVGGAAKALTSGRDWNRAPRYSPDGRQIAIVRDGDGPDEIWLMTAAGGAPRQLTNHSVTRTDWVGGTPTWAPDGKSMAFGRFDTEARTPLWRVDLATKQMTPLFADTSDGSRRSGVFTPDGKSFYFSERSPTGWGGGVGSGSRIFTGIVRIDLVAGDRAPVTDRATGNVEFTPQISRDGRWLAYLRRDREGRTSLRVMGLDSSGAPALGSDRELTAMPDEDEPYRWDDTDERPAYAWSPDSRFIFIGAGGKIHRVAVADGLDEVIPFTAKVDRLVPPVAKARTSLPDGPVEVKGIQWPRLTRDGKTLVFGAVGYLWIQALPAGTPRRLTQAGPDTFEFMPALSPDEKTVAYIRLERRGAVALPGQLVTVPISGGESSVILADKVTLLAPSWSGDGTKIAFIRDAGPKSSFGWVGLADRQAHTVAPVEAAQRETWGRLVFFTKDGTRLYTSREFDPSGGLPDSTELRVVGLDGEGSTLLAMGGYDTRGMIASPDGRHVLVMGVDDDIWLKPLPPNGEPVRTDLSDPGLNRITLTGAEFVDWRDDSTFIYSYANKIYRRSLRGDAPELIHTVKLQFPRFQGHGVVAFTNARIITVSGNRGAGQVIENGTLVVRDRRIVAVGPSASVTVPAAARVIDGTGLTLMPAIGDMHYHSQGGTNLLSKMIFDEEGEIGLPESVPYGVTFGWQPGGPTRNGGGLALAELQQTGRIPGPRWINAPWAVNMATYSDNAPRILSTYADALRSTRHRADLGATVMKEYVTRRRDHRRWLADAAREVGVGIVSHVQGLDQALSRATDGYTGFDHPAFAVPVYDDMRQYLAKTGTSWTPNFNIVWGTDGGATDAERAFVRSALARWPDQASKWDRYYPKRKLDSLPPERPWEQTRVARVAKAAAYLIAGGAKIGISAHNPPALFALGEMWQLEQAGADRGDILRMGTLIGADKMGLDRELGSLEVGKIADILVLDGNPLESMINLVAIRYVLADGVLHEVKPAH